MSWFTQERLCYCHFLGNLIFGEIMFNWFDARDAEKLGVSLADFFMKKMPLDDPKKKSLSIKSKQEVLNTLFSQIHQFKLKHTLNIYQKAKLGNAFKWKLLDANYDPELVDELTKALLLKC